MDRKRRKAANGPKVTVVRILRRLSVPAIAVLLSACSSGEPSFSLPDRNAAGVKQEEARVAAVLAADTTDLLLSRPLQGPPSCKVRLLRKVDAIDYVYAECHAGQEGFSFPIKLDGTKASTPYDGAEYDPSIRRNFPPDIAAALLADEARYKP